MEQVRKRGKRVLVVDDNPDAADTLAMLLTCEGCECRTAYNGEQALALAERERPDVVILDLFMPHLGGAEVARRLRERAGAQCPLLVAHTAMSSYQYRGLVHEAGFDHHLVKPAALDELVALVCGDTDEPAQGFGNHPAPRAGISAQRSASA